MKKEQVLLIAGIIVVALLVISISGLGQVKQLKGEVAKLAQVIKDKDAQTKAVADQLQAKQNELESVRKELDSKNQELNSAKEELAGIKQDISYISKKLTAPAKEDAAPADKAPVKKQ